MRNIGFDVAAPETVPHRVEVLGEAALLGGTSW